MDCIVGWYFSNDMTSCWNRLIVPTVFPLLIPHCCLVEPRGLCSHHAWKDGLCNISSDWGSILRGLTMYPRHCGHRCKIMLQCIIYHHNQPCILKKSRSSIFPALLSNFIQGFCVSHVTLAELSVNIKVIGQVRESQTSRKFKVRHGSKCFSMD